MVKASTYLYPLAQEPVNIRRLNSTARRRSKRLFEMENLKSHARRTPLKL
jgi:hypothetical protein